MESILYDTLVDVVALKADGDDETIEGSGVDMQDVDQAAFIAFAAAGNVGSPTIKLQQDDDVAFGDAHDLTGTSAIFATTAQLGGSTVVEIVQPRERYVRPILTIPNWNAVAVGCICIRHKLRNKPGTNAGELHISPAEGTA